MFTRRMLLLMAFGVGACVGTAYSGPVLHQVMNETCRDQRSMSGLYTCVERYWYTPVSDAGLGSDPEVLKRMELGRKLIADVKSGAISNTGAMSHWRADAIAWKERVEANRASTRQGLRDLGQGFQDLSNSMGSSDPMLCRTTYGQVSSTTTCF